MANLEPIDYLVITREDLFFIDDHLTEHICVCRISRVLQL